jgi:hypothetical protein
MTRDPVRDEAERLVAAAIGSLSMAARGLGGGGRDASGASRFGPVATGSEECCVCPICRVIAAMREPDPGVADRLASGAGDLATALAGILRSFGRAAPSQHRPDHDEAPPAGDEDPWHAATTPLPPKPMAKKAVKKATKAAAAEPAEPAPAKKAVKKAAKKAAKQAPAKKAPAKKAVGRGDTS